MDTTAPNVIMIITDDQGYGDLACHGNPVALTPNLDRLHGESVRFTDFHGAPMCTPTRGQLLTGLDAARNGALNVSSGRTLLRPELPTLANVFRNAGYRTGLFGKWHLGDNYPFRPQDRGFEETIWFPSSHISSLPDYWQNDYFDDVYCHNGERKRYEGYCTEVFFDAAFDWIDDRQRNDEPFFAYLPTNAPHAPLFVPEEDRVAVEEHFTRNEHQLPTLRTGLRKSIIRFLAMIRNLDTQVGRLREFLEDKGLTENTLLIFMTDNGSTFGHNYYNAGMRGNKCTLWEGGHRVPCFIHWPRGGLTQGRDVAGLTEVQDILPTLAELCDLPLPPGGDGISLASVLRGDDAPPEQRMLVVNYSRMPGNMDYPSPDSPAVVHRDGAAVLWKRWRLVEGTALYDLDADPLQETNVLDQHRDVAEAMQKHLDAWWEDVEPVANEHQRVIIGSEKENPSMLSACEWADVFVDQQQQVRMGVRRNSYWHLQVEQAGEYEFELRRWPRESDLALTEASEATTLADGDLEAGKALPIAQARLFIDAKRLAQPVAAGDKAAVFTVNLDAGPVLLHSWFDDASNQPICGAYYIYVNRLPA
ncbi:MAG: arylsulfatase [Lentisphaerae bacterium]|jgi:arylsulfatase A-like enzyme|nr:arylsulfatase [Lentisphaerota bacterium]MBT4823342.1 arylsulfatase [Lentisphaerota bacterium]MBT5608673.1 arylsulfatase [Lentisphaerota bacterium]MBT7057653.1 arylsulfatase [Lentisphaerota bacterium]MBT7840774.1 arylsulfatase [Lentisphaerota bacterium]